MNSFPVILFLDFDGVLHAVGGVTERQRLAKLPLLEALLREPELGHVGIVVSSTWRVAYSLAQLRSVFSPDLRARVCDCTPQLAEHASDYARHEEITAWLARHPEVRGWIAVDDDARGFPRSSHPRVVFTAGDTGLCAADIALLRQRLLEPAAPPG
jgi:hypothetical protein